MSDLVFFGESIRLADEPNEFAMAEFAQAASSVDSNGIAALATIMDLLEACVHPDDWQRFRRTARANRAKVERDLMPVVVAVFESETERPTQRPSVSSDGPTIIGLNSPAGSSQPDIDRLVGRPDLMVVVEDAAAARLTG